MDAPDDTSHSFRVFDRGLVSLLFPLGHGRVRAYLCYPANAEDRLSGDGDIQRFVERSIESGAPAEYYANVKPAGSLAPFNSATTWVEHPYQNHVALIGDAAGATDPMWGQGLALTARDVRVLRDKLIEHEDWDEAGHAYAWEHHRYLTVMHTVEGWLQRLLVETGPEADARRAKALPLWREDPTRRPDTFSSGPDHPIDETVRRRFFGEE